MKNESGSSAWLLQVPVTIVPILHLCHPDHRNALQGRRHGPYLVAFPFGSVVMFGKARQLRERDNWLEACRSVAQLPRAELERPCTEGESGLLWRG